MQLTNRGELKELLAKHGFNNLKGLGQNFLINPAICPKIAASKEEGGFVLEIGPGVGTLTKELAKTSRFVTAVEKDFRLPQILNESLAEINNIKIINEDILNVDIISILNERKEGEKAYVCANLPYYITTPIIMRLLELKLPIQSIIVMVQKEAGARLCAPLGSEQAGSISYAINYYSKPKILFPVSRGSFFPSPKVDSCVIKLDIREKPPINVNNEKKFFSLIRTSFSKRRKMILNTLAPFLGVEKEAFLSSLSKLNIDKNARPANLTLEDFYRIYTLYFGS